MVDMPSGQTKESDLHPRIVRSLLDRYWLSNNRITANLLFVWAAVGLGGGILLADWLNGFTLPGTGFPVGFWLAHQGSILVFVLLILIYCVLMNQLDQRHHTDLENLHRVQPSNTPDQS